MSLQQLKKIRAQRVERLHSELQRSKTFYTQSENEVEQAKKRLRDYGIWRINQEKVLFERLQSDYFSPSEMKDYNITLEKQKFKEERLREEIPVLIGELNSAQNKLDKARNKLQLATKEMEKVQEFIDLQEKEDAAEEEKQEENIVDELSSFKSSLRES